MHHDRHSHWPSAIIVPVWLPYAALIPIYWNLARPVRLPLPIIPGINDRDVSLRWIRVYPSTLVSTPAPLPSVDPG